ncbi:cell wall protein RBR3-like [Cucumis melo var. makuwa]|uniref:Cell wall protein RBR3-like n=1 Tax=Cucumis melo var. makuwa TaxID=1194695 RepID=A0A5A7UT97_CUCMM|nr:cell wall protein RBR3-like [Cucumis melo var. makuwa]TYK21011.1 cell wall protein RBR3-like [Cucumis melo var. makuwa]
MVNTRREKYQVRSTSIGSEDDSSRTNMHDVRIRGYQFKTTPSRRPYRLPSKQNQVSPSDPTKDSLFSDPVDSVVPENVGHHESDLSDMDPNKRDNVPLFHILKRGVFGKNTQLDSDVPCASSVVSSPSGHFVSLHFTSSSSNNDIPASNEPHHSSDNLSQCPDNVDQESNPTHVEPESIPASDNRAPEHPSEVQELDQENEASRDIPNPISDMGEDHPQKKARKASARAKDITTKTGRRKLPPNVSSVLIDGISFHLKESVQR